MAEALDIRVGHQPAGHRPVEGDDLVAQPAIEAGDTLDAGVAVKIGAGQPGQQDVAQFDLGRGLALGLRLQLRAVVQPGMDDDVAGVFQLFIGIDEADEAVAVHRLAPQRVLHVAAPDADHAGPVQHHAPMRAADAQRDQRRGGIVDPADDEYAAGAGRHHRFDVERRFDDRHGLGRGRGGGPQQPVARLLRGSRRVPALAESVQNIMLVARFELAAANGVGDIGVEPEIALLVEIRLVEQALGRQCAVAELLFHARVRLQTFEFRQDIGGFVAHRKTFLTTSRPAPSAIVARSAATLILHARCRQPMPLASNRLKPA